MSKFLTGKELGEAIYDIIWDAEKTLLMVSPFIKLDDYFKKVFDKHKENPQVHIVLVFGKNEKDINKSLNKNDIDFLKTFPNVSLIYVPNLHAKYYGNERKGMITSINLYDYSFKNNIEFGVYFERVFMGKFSKSADNDAWDTCVSIAYSHDVIFIKRPVYQQKRMIINLGKSYIKSEVLYDITDNFNEASQSNSTRGKRLDDFPEELELSQQNSVRPSREEVEKKPVHTTQEIEKKPVHTKQEIEKKPVYTQQNDNGYCIRTGVEIPFNPEKPLCYSAFKTWNEYGDTEYPENYCHFSGELSGGETCVSKPILRKNWKKAKGVFEF